MNPLSSYVTFVNHVEAILQSSLEPNLKLRSIEMLIRGARG